MASEMNQGAWQVHNQGAWQNLSGAELAVVAFEYWLIAAHAAI